MDLFWEPHSNKWLVKPPGGQLRTHDITELLLSFVSDGSPFKTDTGTDEITVVLKVWLPIRQPQYHLETC